MTTLISPTIATGLLSVVFATGLGACAGTPPPNPQMALAEAAVQRASTDSTAELAPAELQRAKGKWTSAQEAQGRKDYLRASQLAEQAQIDAQVAEMHAQAARSRKAARETQDASRVLNEEINRKTTR